MYAGLIAQIWGVLRPGTAQGLIWLTIIAFVAQHRLPRLTGAGARVASQISQGESYRLVTPIFLHADAIHLLKTCFFGLARLVPPAAAIYGTSQCLLLFLASGIAGNAAAYVFGTGGEAMSVGASAALLGLDGALTAYYLRNGPMTSRGRQLVLRRGVLTLLLACVRPSVVQIDQRIDHVAHLAGYLSGVVLGLLVAPRVRVAMAHFEASVCEQMTNQVCETCGASSVEAERAIWAHVRCFPLHRRARVLKRWKLAEGVAEQTAGKIADAARSSMSEEAAPPAAEQDSSSDGAGASTAYRERVPPTEVWSEVFERIKELVAENHLKRSAPAADDDDDDEEENVSMQVRRLRERLRVEAEEATWSHFAHRAAVAMPSMRLLKRAELGHITLQHLRRWRIDLGPLVPRWIGEGLAGLLLVYVAHCCELVVRRAR